MQDLSAASLELIEAYCALLGEEPPVEPHLMRWQSRVLSALRAAGKARDNTNESIRKLTRRLDAGE